MYIYAVDENQSLPCCLRAFCYSAMLIPIGADRIGVAEAVVLGGDGACGGLIDAATRVVSHGLPLTTPKPLATRRLAG